MEDSLKKPIMIGIVVVCLALAVVIAVKRTSNNPLADISDEATTWLKCNNPECGAVLEMKMKDYADYSLQNHNLNGTPLPMKCEKCGEESVVAAVKCEKCGEIFIRGTVKGKMMDTCPKCGYSATLERRKKARP